jgi:hypothetical protein
MPFSFALAWDEDEGDIEASGPGDAEFLTTLNPNAHISLLKRIHITGQHLDNAKADVREIVKRIVPFRVSISTQLQQSSTRSVIYLDVATRTAATDAHSSTLEALTLTELRSHILRMYVGLF